MIRDQQLLETFYLAKSLNYKSGKKGKVMVFKILLK